MRIVVVGTLGTCAALVEGMSVVTCGGNSLAECAAGTAPVNGVCVAPDAGASDGTGAESGGSDADNGGPGAENGVTDAAGANDGSSSRSLLGLDGVPTGVASIHPRMVLLAGNGGRQP
jgi:hypothetical protein